MGSYGFACTMQEGNKVCSAVNYQAVLCILMGEAVLEATVYIRNIKTDLGARFRLS